MATPAKKPKLNKKTKNFFAKQGQKKNSFLKIGDKGFLVTYNFKEKESVREIYKLLNEYFQQQRQSQHLKNQSQEINEEMDADKSVESKKNDDEEEEEDDDIANQLLSEIDKTKKDSQEKANLFQAVETGTNNCVFIKTSISDYHELGVRIIEDLFTSKVKKTKFSNRLIPIGKVCRANMEEIVDAAGQIFDKEFLKQPSTFAINFNRRCNVTIQRDDVIKDLAALVAQKNIRNKVDLKHPEKTILVEIIKGLCLISVIPNYNQYRKYNLNELWARDDSEKTERVSKHIPDDENKNEQNDENTIKPK